MSDTKKTGRMYHTCALASSTRRSVIAGPSNLQGAAEPSRGIIRLSAVVIDEDRSVAMVAEDRAAESSDVPRGPHPARRLRIDRSQGLESPVLRFGQELRAHGGGHTDRAVLRLVLLSRCQRFGVVTNAPPALRALRGTVTEDVLAGLLVLTDDVGLAPRLLHLVERRELLPIRLQSRLHFPPRD